MAQTTSFVPEYHEDSNEAAEYLRMVLPLISRHKTPATPINYSIWYEYVSGCNQRLKEAVDKELDNKAVINDNVSEKLYKEYVMNGMMSRFDSVGSGLNSIVNQTLGDVEKTSEKAVEFAGHFTEHSDNLANSSDLDSVKSVVNGIVADAQQLAEVSTALKDQLKQTTQEVHQLKSELESMKEVAKTDGLTGLLNRRAFDAEMDRVVEEEKGRQDICLLLFDLDHFKRINDDFGHLIGDKVLRYTSSLIKQVSKDEHIAARYGGEELAIIVKGLQQNQALELADEVREALAKSKLKRKDSGEPLGQVTVSVGAAILQAADTVESLIDRADTALYRAKEGGRNKICI